MVVMRRQKNPTCVIIGGIGYGRQHIVPSDFIDQRRAMQLDATLKLNILLAAASGAPVTQGTSGLYHPGDYPLKRIQVQTPANRSLRKSNRVHHSVQELA